MREEAAKSVNIGLVRGMLARPLTLLALLVAGASFAHWGTYGVGFRNFAGAVFGSGLFLAFWVFDACFRYERIRRQGLKRRSMLATEHLKRLQGALLDEARTARATILVDGLDRLWRARTSIEGLLGGRSIPAIEQEIVRRSVDDVAVTVLESGLHRLRLGGADERTESQRTELDRLVGQGVALVQRGLEAFSEAPDQQAGLARDLAQRVDRFAGECREHIERSRGFHQKV